MQTSVDAWLTRFAAGAGSQYRWTLIEVSIGGRAEKLIRACLSTGVVMCPLSAQVTYEMGCVVPVRRWRGAAFLQNMPDWSTGRVIACAADDDEHADTDVRARLLRICDLAR